MRTGIMSLVAPLLLWAYLLSAILARGFWGAVYDGIILKFDLSPNQAWLLPVGFSLLGILGCIPRMVLYARSIRRKQVLPESWHLGSWLCVAACVLFFAAAIRAAVTVRPKLAKASKEVFQARQDDVSAGGQVIGDCYSNGVLGIRIILPKGWHPMSVNSIRRAKLHGAQAAHVAEDVAEGLPGVHVLVAVRKFPEGYGAYNPSLSITAYDKSIIAKTGVTTLDQYMADFGKVRPPYHLISGPLIEKPGNEHLYHAELEARFPQATIHQDVYGTEASTFYIAMVASTIDPLDYAVLRQAVSTFELPHGR